MWSWLFDAHDAVFPPEPWSTALTGLSFATPRAAARSAVAETPCDPARAFGLSGRRRRAEARMRALSALVEGALFSVDARGRMTSPEPAWESYTGQPRETTRRLGFEEAVHEDDRARFVAQWNAGIRSERSFAIDARVMCAQTRVHHPCVLRAAPVISDESDAPSEWLVRLEDVFEETWARREVTRLRERVEERARTESLGILAGGVAHQLNNLLHGVIGHTELAARTLPQDAPARTSLATVVRCAERAADVCRQMLAYAGRGATIIEACDCSALVRGSAERLHGLCMPGTQLEIACAAELPYIRANPQQIELAIENLVANAAEAVAQQGGTITVCTHARYFQARELEHAQPGAHARAGNYVVIEVEDDGVGMPPEVRERACDPFFSTKFAGRGLGLAAVLGMARSMSGCVIIDSIVGMGTRVRILLPEAPGAVAHEPVRSAQPVKRLHGSVLVVEDESHVRELATLALTSEGAKVRKVSTGEEALQLCRAIPDLDAVLLDLTLPVMGGAETLAALREENPGVRVVVMQGPETPRLPDHLIDGVVAKPFTSVGLIEVMRNVLARPSARVAPTRPNQSGTYASVVTGAAVA